MHGQQNIKFFITNVIVEKIIRRENNCDYSEDWLLKISGVSHLNFFKII